MTQLLSMDHVHTCSIIFLPINNSITPSNVYTILMFHYIGHTDTAILLYSDLTWFIDYSSYGSILLLTYMDHVHTYSVILLPINNSIKLQALPIPYQSFIMMLSAIILLYCTVLYRIACVVNEENWFRFPGKFALKLVRFFRKKVSKSGLIFHLQYGGKKCSILVQFSTRFQL